jgi:hypothetical protein
MNIDKFYIKDNIYYYENNELKVTKNSQGYSRVTILGKAQRLHRLIALKYISNPFLKPIVDHIDNNKSNNSINNLQWLTYSENSKKAYSENQSMSNFTNKLIQKKSIISEKDNIKTKHLSLRQCANFVQRDVAAVYRVLNKEWNLCNGYKLYYQ